MIIPASLGLLLTTLPPDRVKRGVRVWAVSGAAAGSIGPVIGGLLTALSWRWIFLINLPKMMTNGAATSLDQVNAEARVSRSQIYHYFADENVLISAVLTYQCGLVLAAHEAALQALVSTGDIVGWREFVIQAFQSRSCETGYLPASLWGEVASESNEHQDIIRTMYVRWGLALSQSFERVHSNEPVLRLPDVSMFGLAASTVLHGGFGLSAIHGDVRPLEEALEIMLQV